jgi:hypothetical protein
MEKIEITQIQSQNNISGESRYMCRLNTIKSRTKLADGKMRLSKLHLSRDVMYEITVDNFCHAYYVCPRYGMKGSGFVSKEAAEQDLHNKLFEKYLELTHIHAKNLLYDIFHTEEFILEEKGENENNG